jgi:hypothetical protein
MAERDFFKQEEDDFDSHEDEAGFLLVLSDTFLSFLAVVLCIVVLLMLQDHAKKHPPALNTTGALCVELTWPQRDVDLDLWGHSPGDPDTVGFSNMHGKDMNLLRDVIGFNGNPTHTMLEMICADRLVPGEWIFNVHYFANHEDELKGTPADDPRKAIKATMFVRVKNENTKADLDSFIGEYTLTYEKQEKTMFRFIVKEDGTIDHDTISSQDKPLKRGWRE